MPPYLPSKEGPSQGWPDSQRFSCQLLSVIPFNSPGEAKIKINEKPCRVLTDTGLHSLLETLLTLEPADGILGKPAEAKEGWEFLPASARSDLCSAPLRKVKFQVFPSFPKPEPLVVDPFSPRNSRCLLVCLILCPANLAWLSACLGHTGCQFLLVQAAQPSSWGPKNTAWQKCGLHSVCSSYMAGQEMGCTSFAARVLLTAASSQRNCLGLSFFWTILGSGSGSWEGGILCIRGGRKDVGPPNRGSQPQQVPRAWEGSKEPRNCKEPLQPWQHPGAVLLLSCRWEHFYVGRERGCANKRWKLPRL